MNDAAATRPTPTYKVVYSWTNSGGAIFRGSEAECRRYVDDWEDESPRDFAGAGVTVVPAGAEFWQNGRQGLAHESGWR